MATISKHTNLSDVLIPFFRKESETQKTEMMLVQGQKDASD